MRMVSAARFFGKLIGRTGGVDLLRYEDPLSGARLLFGVQDNNVISCHPSFASQSFFDLDLAKKTEHDGLVTIEMLASFEPDPAQLIDSREPAVAEIFAAFEFPMLSVSCTCEQYPLMLETHRNLPCSLVLLGVKVAVYSDPATYIESQTGQNPFSPTSLSSYWPFDDSSQPSAYGHLSGIVISSERKTNSMTRQEFVVAHVRTAYDLEAVICLDGAEFHEALIPGQVVAGTVYIVVSLPGLEQVPSPPSWRDRFRLKPRRRG